MKEQRGYPLDYIISIPPLILQKHYVPRHLNAEILQRRLRLKNAVIRRVVEIRVMKAKPKLSALLNELKDPRLKDPYLSKEEKEVIKTDCTDKLRKKIQALYDDTGESVNDFDTITNNLKAIRRKVDT